MLSIPVRSPTLNSDAAMIIIDRLTAPAIVIAITTSIFSNRRICAPLVVVSPDDPALGQRRVQVDDVRHHRRPDDPGGQQDALGAARSRARTDGGRRRRRPASPRRSRTRSRAGRRRRAPRSRLEPTEAALLEGEDREGAGAGDQRRREERDPEQQVEAERRADHLGDVGRPSRRPRPGARGRSTCAVRRSRGRAPAGSCRSRSRASPTASGSASRSGSPRPPPRAAGSRTGLRRRCWWRSCPGRCRRPRR